MLLSCTGQPGKDRTPAVAGVQGVRPETPSIDRLRALAAADGAHGPWLVDESQGKFADLPPDEYDGFESYDASVDQVGSRLCDAQVASSVC